MSTPRKPSGRKSEEALFKAFDASWESEEIKWLQASEIACAVADAWVKERPHPEVVAYMLPTTFAALDRLEAVTRPSAMRKVRP